MRRTKSLSEYQRLFQVMLTLGVVAIIGLPSEAYANWNFDPSCSAAEVTELEAPDPPNVYMQLDQSGSMGFLEDSSGQNPLWAVAVGALDNVIGVMETDVRFGLGLFPCNWGSPQTGYGERWNRFDGAYNWLDWDYALNYTNGDIFQAFSTTSRCHTGLASIWSSYFGISSSASWQRSGASEAAPSGANNHSTIMDVLWYEAWPRGGTPITNAFNDIGSSQSMNDPNYTSGAVMITDGFPNDPGSAVQAACDLRGDHLTYVAGLGGATDTEFNNLMAAAAGTGECSGGDPCENNNVDQNTCSGAFQASNQTEFQNIINEIGDTLQCTFDVDTTLHVNDEVPDDPGAVQVQMLTASGLVDLPHRNDSEADPSGHGWYFPSDSNNNQITLTSHYCNMVQEGDVDSVTTRLACDCSQLEGQECEVSDPDDGECHLGETVCSQGFALCDPYPPELCPITCEDLDIEGAPCHVDDDTGLVASEISGPEDVGATLEGEVNRCKVGAIACTDSDSGAPDLTCNQALSPMPEVCDGMDNSCSGSTDDIGASWDAFYAGAAPFDGDDWDDDLFEDLSWQGPTCNETSALCVCDTPRSTHAGSPADTVFEEFESYLDDWDPSFCSCSPALQP